LASFEVMMDVRLESWVRHPGQVGVRLIGIAKQSQRAYSLNCSSKRRKIKGQFIYLDDLFFFHSELTQRAGCLEAT